MSAAVVERHTPPRTSYHVYHASSRRWMPFH